MGLNLRLEYIDQILESRPSLPFLEIIIDNWFTNGSHYKKLQEIREIYPISFHCVGLNLGGQSQLDQSYINRVKELAKKFTPFQISDHLCFQNSKTTYFHDLLPIPFNQEALKNTVSRVNEIQNRLETSILIENLSYYIEYTNSTMTEIDFLNGVTDETGSSILLDINNIWVNEINLQHDAEEYLNKVQWDKVKEVHMAGAEYINDIYIDTHGSDIDQNVFNLLHLYKDKIQKLPIVYERDNNIPPLDSSLLQIEKIRNHL